MSPRLSTVPDTRYGCVMSDGKTFSGTLLDVIKDAALETHKTGHSVASWQPPGNDLAIVARRTRSLITGYWKELERLTRLTAPLTQRSRAQLDS